MPKSGLDKKKIRPTPPRGRPTVEREISPSRIVSVTQRMIRRGGFSKVSMRQVAAELGVTATALYNHFPNKASLLDAVARRIYDAIPLPPTDLPWTERLRRWLLDQELAHLDHPGLASFVLSRHRASTAAFRWIDTVLSILHEGGLDDESQLLCMRRVAFMHNPLIYLDAPERQSEARNQSATDVAQQNLHAQFPQLARLQSRWYGTPQREDFEAALKHSIDGLARMARYRRSDL